MNAIEEEFWWKQRFIRIGSCVVYNIPKISFEREDFGFIVNKSKESFKVEYLDGRVEKMNIYELNHFLLAVPIKQEGEGIIEKVGMVNIDELIENLERSSEKVASSYPVILERSTKEVKEEFKYGMSLTKKVNKKKYIKSEEFDMLLSKYFEIFYQLDLPFNN